MGSRRQCGKSPKHGFRAGSEQMETATKAVLDPGVSVKSQLERPSRSSSCSARRRSTGEDLSYSRDARRRREKAVTFCSSPFLEDRASC